MLISRVQWPANRLGGPRLLDLDALGVQIAGSGRSVHSSPVMLARSAASHESAQKRVLETRGIAIVLAMPLVSNALGLEVHITEFDVRFKENWNAEAEKQQAAMYARALQICLEVKACKSFESWGFADDAQDWHKGMHPYPFDKNYKPKAALASMLEVLDGPSPAPTPTPTPVPTPTPSGACTFQQDRGTVDKNPIELNPASSKEECCSQCSSNAECTHFTFTKASKCKLRSGLVEYNDMPGFVSGEIVDNVVV